MASESARIDSHEKIDTAKPDDGLTRTFGTVGNYTLTASYNGDTNNLASTSSPLTLTVRIEPQVYYIHTDHLDTPREITDTAGTVVWQWDNSDPFGANMPNENPGGVGQFTFNLRFAGQYHDRETGLNYNVNRDYSPTLGRYIESDPMGLVGGINTYTYVEGNPLIWIDPWGLETENKPGGGTYSKDSRAWTESNKSSSSFWGKWFGKNNKKYDPAGCSKKMSTYQECYACCQAEAQSCRGGTGNPCRIECDRTAYPDNPYGPAGL